MSSRKDYIKYKTEIFISKNGLYTKKRILIDKGKLSEHFLDELWENDSIDNNLLAEKEAKKKWMSVVRKRTWK